MKNVAIIALAIACLCACSGPNSTGSTTGASPDSAVVIQQVNEIYEKVIEYYDRTGGSQAVAPDALSLTGTLDSLYCTQDWNSCVARVNAYDASHNDGMMGFFDADYWIMGQDWKDLSVSDVRLVSMTDSTATVELNLHNCGHVTAVRLAMAHNQGEWRIDNFIDATSGYDWKAGMKEYLVNNQNKQ